MTYNEDLDKTLKERGSRYGDFSDNAKITQGLMRVIKDAPQFENLHDMHIEIIHNIFNKISRMVCGDFMYEDNPHDIAGYAKGLEDYIRKCKND